MDGVKPEIHDEKEKSISSRFVWVVLVSKKNDWRRCTCVDVSRWDATRRVCLKRRKKDGRRGTCICGTADERGMDADRRYLGGCSRKRTSLLPRNIDEDDPSGKCGCEKHVFAVCSLVDSKQVDEKETWDDKGTKKKDEHVHVEPFERENEQIMKSRKRAVDANGKRNERTTWTCSKSSERGIKGRRWKLTD